MFFQVVGFLAEEHFQQRLARGLLCLRARLGLRLQRSRERNKNNKNYDKCCSHQVLLLRAEPSRVAERMRRKPGEESSRPIVCAQCAELCSFRGKPGSPPERINHDAETFCCKHLAGSGVRRSRLPGFGRANAVSSSKKRGRTHMISTLFFGCSRLFDPSRSLSKSGALTSHS